jgi:hypothetical protein
MDGGTIGQIRGEQIGLISKVLEQTGRTSPFIQTHRHSPAFASLTAKKLQSAKARIEKLFMFSTSIIIVDTIRDSGKITLDIVKGNCLNRGSPPGYGLPLTGSN